MSWEQLGDLLGRAPMVAVDPTTHILRPQPVRRRRRPLPRRKPMVAAAPAHLAERWLRPIKQHAPVRRFRPLVLPRGRGRELLLSDFTDDLRTALANPPKPPAVKAPARKKTPVKKATPVKTPTTAAVDPQVLRARDIRATKPEYLFAGSRVEFAADYAKQISLTAAQNTRSSAMASVGQSGLRVIDVVVNDPLKERPVVSPRITVVAESVIDHERALDVRSMIEGSLYRAGLKNFGNVSFRVVGEPAFVTQTVPVIDVPKVTPSPSPKPETGGGGGNGGNHNNSGNKSGSDMFSDLFGSLGMSVGAGAVAAFAGLVLLLKVVK